MGRPSLPDSHLHNIACNYILLYSCLCCDHGTVTCLARLATQMFHVHGVYRQYDARWVTDFLLEKVFACPGRTTQFAYKADTRHTLLYRVCRETRLLRVRIERYEQFHTYGRYINIVTASSTTYRQIVLSPICPYLSLYLTDLTKRSCLTLTYSISLIQGSIALFVSVYRQSKCQNSIHGNHVP